MFSQHEIFNLLLIKHANDKIIGHFYRVPKMFHNVWSKNWERANGTWIFVLYFMISGLKNSKMVFVFLENISNDRLYEGGNGIISTRTRG